MFKIVDTMQNRVEGITIPKIDFILNNFIANNNLYKIIIFYIFNSFKLIIKFYN